MKVIGFAGWSGSGKTALIEAVVAILTRRGFVVSLVKHAHHSFDVDHAGKDSWRHRRAGCREVLVSSGRRWSLMHELDGEPEPALPALLTKLSPCDVVLVEGYKRAAIPKIEVYRAEVGEPLLFPDDPQVVAIATNADVDARVPRLDLDDPHAVADFVVAYLSLGAAASSRA